MDQFDQAARQVAEQANTMGAPVAEENPFLQLVDEAIKQRNQTVEQRCEKLQPQDRAADKACILNDNPIDGWKIVQRMERQEAFLDALPAIIAALVALMAFYRLWVKFGATVKRAFNVAAHSLGAHFSNPIRLLQWILAFVGTTATVILWKLL